MGPGIRWTTAVPQCARGPTSPSPRARTWSQEPHHRRRRAIAVITLGLLGLLVVAALVLAGGRGTSLRAKPVPGGFLQRVRTLAGDGPQSFAGRELAAENAAVD